MRFNKIAKILNFIKIAITEANIQLRNDFAGDERFKSENKGKINSIADQWYNSFYETSKYGDETPKYGEWKSVEIKTLDDVITFIRDNPSKKTVEGTTQILTADSLKQKFPEYAQGFDSLNEQFIAWINSRFGDKTSKTKLHTLSDCIPTLIEYQEKLPGIIQKYNSNQEFKEAVDSTVRVHPNTVKQLTIDQMVEIIGLSQREKGGIKIPQGYKPREFIGQFGPWKLWMPITREDSIVIAGYNPLTMQPDTTWCTARIAGSNLFYNYAGTGIILFYAIKDGATPGDPNAYQSIGWMNGEILYKGDGTETVNASNAGITKEGHERIFGDQFNPIYEAMGKKVSETGGSHPAQAKFMEAATNEVAYQDMIKNVEKDGVNEINTILEQNRNKIINDPSSDKEKIYFIANKWAENNPGRLFYYLDTIEAKLEEEVKGPASVAAENLAGNDPRSFFSYFDTIQEALGEKAKELALVAAQNLAENNPSDFFYYFDDIKAQIGEVEAEKPVPVAAKKLAENNPSSLFYYFNEIKAKLGEEKARALALGAAQNLAQNDPDRFFYYFYQIKAILGEEKAGEPVLMAAQNLAQNNPDRFFYYFYQIKAKLGEEKAAEPFLMAAQNLAQNDPDRFFYHFDTIQEVLGEGAKDPVLMAANYLAENDPSSFFLYFNDIQAALGEKEALRLREIAEEKQNEKRASSKQKRFNKIARYLRLAKIG